MTRIIGCLGAKGGTGKTMITANLGVALAQLGKDVLALDTNLTTPNLGLHLGIPLYPVTLHDVLKARVRIAKAIYHHPSGLKVVPAGIGLADLRGADPRALQTALLDLLGSVEIILLDAAAGLGREALTAIEVSDEILLITNPELPAVVDALKAAKLAHQLGTKTTGLVINRISGRAYELTSAEIFQIIDIPILAQIPEDLAVKQAIAERVPVVLHAPRSPASQQLKALAAQLAGLYYQAKQPWYRRLVRWFR